MKSIGTSSLSSARAWPTQRWIRYQHRTMNTPSPITIEHSRAGVRVAYNTTRNNKPVVGSFRAFSIAGNPRCEISAGWMGGTVSTGRFSVPSDVLRVASGPIDAQVDGMEACA